MILVTKRLDWYKNKVKAVFGGVKVYDIEGYYIFIGEKRKKYIDKLKKSNKGITKKLRRKYEKRNAKI